MYDFNFLDDYLAFYLCMDEPNYHRVQSDWDAGYDNDWEYGEDEDEFLE